MEVIKEEIVVLLMAMLPVWELRGTIPFAVEVFHLNLFKAAVISLIGNTLSVILILLYLENVARVLSSRFTSMDRFFKMLFEKTRKKHSQRVELLADLALLTFVAIPLPGTGGWTGALIAVVFNLNKWRSFLSIFFGLIGAAIIISLTYTGSKALMIKIW